MTRLSSGIGPLAWIRIRDRAGLRQGVAVVLMVTAMVRLAVPGEAPVAEQPLRPELRGTWLDEETYQDPQRRSETLDLLAAAKLNTIFAIAPSINGNWGGGTTAAYGALIQEATRRGFSVHGWILCHKRKGPDTQLDLSDSNEQRAQAEWAVALLDRYPDLAGVHLDYIRYRTSEADMERVDAVTETVRGIRSALNAAHQGKALTAAVFVAVTPNFLGLFDRGQIASSDAPAWYRQWYNDHPDNWYATAHQRDAKLGSYWALGPKHLRFGQDPITWLHEDLVDGVMPMQYTFDHTVWRQELDLWKSFLGGKLDGVYMGLGFHSQQNRPTWKQDPASVVQHIHYGRENEWPGGVIYRVGMAGELDGELVAALTKEGAPGGVPAPFTETAPSPVLSRNIVGLQAGDANQDLEFDQFDLIHIQQVAKYFTGEVATWGEGDWNNAPGGSPGNPPPGDGLFDQRDLIRALEARLYLTGPYVAPASTSSMAAVGETVAASPVPEPSTAVLVAIALIGMVPLMRHCT